MTNSLPKVLVTGSHGQLGSALQKIAPHQPFELIGSTRDQLDITRFESVKNAVENFKPDYIIHAAAYTAVDKAETERTLAKEVNVLGTTHMARICHEKSIPLIHISTDYVFDGKKSSPYQEEDPINPINYYGETKALAEDAVRDHCPNHVILRVSGVFSEFGQNFFKTILRLAQEREILNIVNDQITCPTDAIKIADALFTILKHPLKVGTFHFCSAPPVSWFEFAESIIATAKHVYPLKLKQLNPIPSSSYETPAKRPAYSVLDCNKIKMQYGIQQPSWQDDIKQTLQQLIEMAK